MTVSAEVAAMQAAYAARPFAARVESSHFATTQRFHTEAEAVDYLFQMVRVVRRDIASRPPGDGSWIAMDLHRSNLQRPNGEVIPARFVVLLDRLASH